MALTTGPYRFEPRFWVKDGAMATDGSLRFGYVDVATSREDIFALFSGRAREGFKEEAPLGDYVHVFSWDGAFRRALKLDAGMLAVAVDPAGMILYGARINPTPAIVRYSLPALYEDR